MLQLTYSMDNKSLALEFCPYKKIKNLSISYLGVRAQKFHICSLKIVLKHIELSACFKMSKP